VRGVGDLAVQVDGLAGLDLGRERVQLRRGREHRLEDAGRELLVALLDQPPHVDHGARPQRAPAADELAHEPRVGPGRDPVARRAR